MDENIITTERKSKRDIFHIIGSKPVAINLEHVTMITLDEKRITITFQGNSMSVDLATDEEAKNIYDKLIDIWASDLPNHNP